LRPIQPSAEDLPRSYRSLQLPWSILLLLGTALTIVGWVDIALLWWPLSLGNVEWEFGTISATFDGLPLGTIGLSLAGAAALGGRRFGIARAAGIAMLVVAFGLIAIYLLYLLTLAPAWRGTPEAVQPSLLKAAIKTTIFAITYVTAFAWIGLYLIRARRRRGYT
jgi:hypothetical protein